MFRAHFASFIQISKKHNLNYTPHSIVIFILCIIFGCASYFLQKYVVTAETALVVGIVGSYVVFTSYFTFDYYLKQLSSSYKNIPEDKQFYVLSNLIKSAALFAYSPLAAQLLYETMYLDVWNSNKIRIMGTLYSIPDFVSLIVVKRMANTTKIHHVVVVVFNIISCYNDYTKVNVVRAIMVYAVFSVFSYLVNLLLASRFMQTSQWTKFLLSLLALIIYAACCFFNWSWQFLYLSKIFSNNQIAVVLYVCLMSQLVRDDYILMKWLYKNLVREEKRRRAESESDKED